MTEAAIAKQAQDRRSEGLRIEKRAQQALRFESFKMAKHRAHNYPNETHCISRQLVPSIETQKPDSKPRIWICATKDATNELTSLWTQIEADKSGNSGKRKRAVADREKRQRKTKNLKKVHKVLRRTQLVRFISREVGPSNLGFYLLPYLQRRVESAMDVLKGSYLGLADSKKKQSDRRSVLESCLVGVRESPCHAVRSL